MTELPFTVRYVKNGAGGRWWPSAKGRSQIHAGWADVSDDLIRTGDMIGIEAAIRAYYHGKQGSTQDANAIRTLLQEASQHIWITFQDGFMWWATARDGALINAVGETESVGHFWLDLDRPWDNRSLAGRYLAMSELPGVVTTTAGFKGTVCEPKGWKEVLRLIRDEEDEDAAAAIAARQAYQGAVGKLVARLGPKDFEVLIDLVLARSGWTRIARLGGVTEGIDVEVENPAVDEIAFVQVKGQARQDTLDDYVGRFRKRRERYDRMIFAVHSPRGSLVPPGGEPVQIWDQPKVAELVVKLGLGDWVAKRL